jgi:glycosyltransferase involved in cell wall biosynthesis
MLLLVEASSAGVGRHVIDLAGQLLQLGHEVHLLYSPRRIDERFSRGIVRLRAEGAITAELDIAHQVSLADVRVIRQIRRHLIAYGPFDITHCHSTKAGLVGRIAAVGQCHSVYTPHAFMSMDPATSRIKYHCVKTLEKTLSLLGGAVVCVSDEELHHAEGLGIRSRKLVQIFNGICLKESEAARVQRQDLRASLGLKPDELCIGFVGRLYPQKAPEMLVEAFASVASKVPVARLCVLGEGPLLPAITSQASRYALNDRITFVGAAKGLQFMAAFDLFALPSCYEGFPYVLLEALSMGLPIVSTRVGGASALVACGENGYVVPVGQPQAFASALERILLDDALRRRMGAASLVRSEKFTVERMAVRTAAVYSRFTANSMLARSFSSVTLQ